MNLDLILLARAQRSDIDAGYIQSALDLTRQPRDRADAMWVRFWTNAVAMLREPEAMLATGQAGALSYASALPEYVVNSSGPIHELVRAWNAGEGLSWRHPEFRRAASRPQIQRVAERAA